MTDEHASEPDETSADDREPPPGLPEIREEAADTPRWVPLLGLTLLVLSVLAVGLTATLTSDEVDDEAGAVVDANDEASDDN